MVAALLDACLAERTFGRMSCRAGFVEVLDSVYIRDVWVSWERWS